MYPKDKTQAAAAVYDLSTNKNEPPKKV